MFEFFRFPPRKPEQLNQTVFDVHYAVECPICKKTVTAISHVYEEREVGCTDWFPCPDCHIVLCGKQVKLVTIHKTYERDEDVLVGLRLINEEEKENRS